MWIQIRNGRYSYSKVGPKPINVSLVEQEQINKEIYRFLGCGIIEKVYETSEGETFQTFSLDGKIRIIITLKIRQKLPRKNSLENGNTSISYKCYGENCYFRSVFLAEAFYSIPIKEADKKYFRCMHNGQKFSVFSANHGFDPLAKNFHKKF